MRGRVQSSSRGKRNTALHGYTPIQSISIMQCGGTITDPFFFDRNFARQAQGHSTGPSGPQSPNCPHTMSNLENEIHTLRNLQRLFHEAFPEHLYGSTAVYLRGATSCHVLPRPCHSSFAAVLAALGPRVAVMTRTRATEFLLS